MNTGARISHCGMYRYSLWRIWNDEKKRLVFVMLNPSTADQNTDDPTIRRCMRFAGGMGYGGILVVNLFAYRATDPAELPDNDSAIGPDNDVCLSEIGRDGAGYDVVFAWGTKGVHLKRNQAVAAMFPNAYCLEKTKDGHPKHPLYIRADAKLIRFQSNELVLSEEA